MRKFITTIFILLVIGCAGLFFGWAQMSVPPDAYGVIRSKSHGIDDRLIKPGEFIWIWYKLIPTNAQTAIFRPGTVNHHFFVRDTLPSGSIYSAFAGIGEDFAWEINAAFSFRLQPESLISLVTSHNIGTQEELAQLERDICGQIENFLLHRMVLNEEFASEIETLLIYGDTSDIERDIQRQFPIITDFSLNIRSAIAPDFSLYRQIKGLYEEYIVLQRELFAEVLRERARTRAETYARFNELEMYGELLSRFPLLLDFMALENSR